jgi:hypothetical protein
MIKSRAEKFWGKLRSGSINQSRMAGRKRGRRIAGKQTKWCRMAVNKERRLKDSMAVITPSNAFQLHT